MIWTIAKREIATRGRSKGFLISTAVLFVGVIAAALAIMFLTGGDDTAREVNVAVIDGGVPYAPAIELDGEDLNVTVSILEGRDAVNTAVDEGEFDVAFDGTNLIWKSFPDPELDRHIAGAVQEVEFSKRATELGLTGADIGQLFTPVELEETRLDGDDSDFAVRAIVAAASGAATFMLLQVWGAFMLMGVVEEKQSKVVEVLLSHVRPQTLLSGKVLGLGVLAIVQMLILGAGMAIGLMLTQDIDIPDGVWSTIPLFVVIFLLGFAFYATAFGAVGSMVSRQEDAQSAQLPVMLPLFIGYAVAAGSFAAPENVAIKVLSFVPFTSPVVMPFRNAFTDVPMVQILISLAILVASTFIMIQVAGKIYRYSLLRTGSRVTWKEALTGSSD